MRIYSWRTRHKGEAYHCYCSKDRTIHRAFKMGVGSLAFVNELTTNATIVHVSVAPMGMEILCLRHL